MALEFAATIVTNELSSCYFEGTLKDEQGVVVPLASLSSITLTLFGKKVDDIINSRDDDDVLNAGGGTYHATSGLFTMTFDGDDSPIITASSKDGKVEDHWAMFDAQWGTGGRLIWLVKIRVRQLRRVP
jgi:hypothetical protein